MWGQDPERTRYCLLSGMSKLSWRQCFDKGCIFACQDQEGWTKRSLCEQKITAWEKRTANCCYQFLVCGFWQHRMEKSPPIQLKEYDFSAFVMKKVIHANSGDSSGYKHWPPSGFWCLAFHGPLCKRWQSATGRFILRMIRTAAMGNEPTHGKEICPVSSVSQCSCGNSTIKTP